MSAAATGRYWLLIDIEHLLSVALYQPCLTMAVIETVKEAIGLGHSGATETFSHLEIGTNDSPDSPHAPTPASREAMSEARVPLAYRDSCAGLLIPLNKCRHDTFFAIWKCEVSGTGADHLPSAKALNKNVD